MAKSNGELKIEKGVPIPAKATSGLLAAMRQMKVGDSILIPERQRSSVTQTARYAGIKATSRRVAEGQVRVWLVK